MNHFHFHEFYSMKFNSWISLIENISKIVYWIQQETHETYQHQREYLKRINLLFNVMWPKLIQICVGVFCEEKNIQFWHVIIEMWWYEKTNMERVLIWNCLLELSSKRMTTKRTQSPPPPPTFMYHYHYNFIFMFSILPYCLSLFLYFPSFIQTEICKCTYTLLIIDD